MGHIVDCYGGREASRFWTGCSGLPLLLTRGRCNMLQRSRGCDTESTEQSPRCLTDRRLVQGDSRDDPSASLALV